MIMLRTNNLSQLYVFFFQNFQYSIKLLLVRIYQYHWIYCRIYFIIYEGVRKIFFDRKYNFKNVFWKQNIISFIYLLWIFITYCCCACTPSKMIFRVRKSSEYNKLWSVTRWWGMMGGLRPLSPSDPPYYHTGNLILIIKNK